MRLAWIRGPGPLAAAPAGSIFSVAQFKDRFALSRKWAIPLLEHLDSTGVTRRAGDDRLLVAPKPGA